MKRLEKLFYMENIKVQITLPVETLDLLKNDAITFGFIKKNKEEVNLGGLMNTIFANYLGTFRKNRENLKNEIKKIFNTATNNVNKKTEENHKKLSENFGKFKIPDKYEDELIHQIALFTEKKNFLREIKNKETIRYELHINKENKPLFDSCIELIGSNSTYSAFFRNLFISYSSLSLDQRELIIFKPIADKLLKAILSKNQIRITIDKKNFTVSPVALSSTNTDSCNYLFAASDILDAVNNGSYQLSQIKYVEIIDKKNDLPQHLIELLQNGKYLIQTIHEKSLIKIHFTEKGIKMFSEMAMFDTFVLHKDNINRIYTFLCTIDEITILLTKLKENVIILEPSSIAIFAQERLYLNKGRAAPVTYYNILED